MNTQENIELMNYLKIFAQPYASNSLKISKASQFNNLSQRRNKVLKLEFLVMKKQIMFLLCLIQRKMGSSEKKLAKMPQKLQPHQNINLTKQMNKIFLKKQMPLLLPDSASQYWEFKSNEGQSKLLKYLLKYKNIQFNLMQSHVLQQYLVQIFLR
ncbi:hypothetical protein TTHERM_001026281 (macronuclear) [Tetrahymena thermophila SB210]|uniref:Uncharacterized protein n=1 Tax=Tetrahymena thermophila (strain SB210) TaxID=312017 RepID=W7X9F8_TETTS|nr:hypothetical protein TTHERM_001026281 [Tetrahymena thermophila SB210]EWS76040.1 hypothetical protein TTHERM_001026281 [Tetrahymena thermophila SB210]|eukprot:XP_012651424.1 hypothetical protein TTHERM_001026281 [Tetrahymena thermophila SB210]